MAFELSDDLLKDWTVLVVDDEPDSLLVAKKLLARCGADVVTATNGRQALEIARDRHPRFIISDISMPELDGWELIEAIKRDRATAEIPVIALTAHAMEGDRAKAIGAGFHNYLSKPLMPETFVSDLLTLLIDVPEIARDLGQES
ncbi:MAG: response regulator [Chloroflexi bacterium]|nr:response regulator [Chloroflexota bacterium]